MVWFGVDVCNFLAFVHYLAEELDVHGHSLLNVRLAEPVLDIELSELPERVDIDQNEVCQQRERDHHAEKVLGRFLQDQSLIEQAHHKNEGIESLEDVNHDVVVGAEVGLDDDVADQG